MVKVLSHVVLCVHNAGEEQFCRPLSALLHPVCDLLVESLEVPPCVVLHDVSSSDSGSGFERIGEFEVFEALTTLHPFAVNAVLFVVAELFFLFFFELGAHFFDEVEGHLSDFLIGVVESC